MFKINMSQFIAITFLSTAVAGALPTSFSGISAVDEKPVLVETQGKKATVVVFLSAKCPCSNSHVKELNALVKDYPTIQFVGVHANADEVKSLRQTYFQSVHLDFPILDDHEQKLANQFGAYKTPHAFVVSSTGEVLYRGGVSSSAHFDSAEEKYLREALKDISSGQKVRKPEGRTLGCVIDREGNKNVW